MVENFPRTPLSFYRLSWPIFLDNALRMSVVFISSWLASSISDQAAATMVVANTFVVFFFALIECFAQKSITVITQYRGAGLEERAAQSAFLAILQSFLLGLVVSFIFFIFSSYFLGFMTSDPLIKEHGHRYMMIIGSGYGIYSVGYSFIYILNSYGRTKISMIYSVFLNASTLIFIPILFLGSNKVKDYHLLYDMAIFHLWIRIFGTLLLSYWVSQMKIWKKDFKKSLFSLKKEALMLFRIGIANLIEPLSHHITQIVFIKIIASIGTYALAARGYTVSILGILEIGAFSFSRGSQIIIGHSIGGKRYKEADRQMNKSIFVCLGLSCFISAFVLLWESEMTHLFTRNPWIAQTLHKLIWISILISFLRCMTFNLSGALKSAADFRFLSIVFLFLPFFSTIPLSYFLVTFVGSDISLIWMVLMVEEILRVLILKKRWEGGRWKRNVLVHKEEALCYE